MRTRRAVVLLSGGLDSSTTLFEAARQGFELFALSFDYGQRHRHEIEAARRIARAAGVAEQRILELDPRALSGSALTGEREVPKDRSDHEIGTDIPPTYVPACNTLFLAYALAWAEALGTGDIFIGVNAVDYSGYPDCRPEYIQAYERMANLATKAAVQQQRRVTVHTPVIQMTKAQIIRKGMALGVDYALTRSCYDPDTEGRACGQCDACLLRLQGFAENYITDPAPYQTEGRAAT